MEPRCFFSALSAVAAATIFVALDAVIAIFEIFLFSFSVALGFVVAAVVCSEAVSVATAVTTDVAAVFVVTEL